MAYDDNNYFQKKIEQRDFVLTAEISPPRGPDISRELDRIQYLKGIDAINVTDNQRAMLHLSSMAFSHILKNNLKSHPQTKHIEPIFQLTCRDRNRLALQSDLLGAHALGLRNILALTGDHPALGDHPEAKIVYDVDSIQLLEMIQCFNKGIDVRNAELNSRTDFFTGAVVNPGAELLDLQLIKMKKKIIMGANFFQTQLVFDIEQFRQFVTKARSSCRESGLDLPPIIAGIMPLRSAKMARYLNENLPGIRIPDYIIEEIDVAKKPIRKGLDICANTIRELKQVADGIHIMTMGKEKNIPRILEMSHL